VQLFGVCSKPICIVTEFLQQGTLSDVLGKRKEAITELQMIRWAKDIASGMHHLHMENIIHRDLAGRNVLVTETGVCKVADFGFARLANNEVNVTASNVGPIRVSNLLSKKH
jgi:serine/threonine protein kinase